LAAEGDAAPSEMLKDGLPLLLLLLQLVALLWQQNTQRSAVKMDN